MAEATSAAGAKQQDKPRQEGSVKETIESILVAFILAFIFRAFVVEAFVIPTGSMGPTLMGAHLRLQCPDCGYQFAVNFSTRSGDDTDIPSAANFRPGEVATCPNCGYQIPLSGTQPVYFGDRILVLKYRYLFHLPNRWDVVVFKSPYQSPFSKPPPDPNDPKFVDNYIKRLIGLPNESIMILDGDIYIGSKDQKPEQFRIQRKPEHAQAALWREVYNNDYLPHEDRVDWREPWGVEGGTGWKGPDGGSGRPSRVFAFDNAQGSSALRFDSTVNHSFDALTDWIAYDQTSSGAYVSDLRLACTYTRTAGQGPLKLQLTKRSDAFTAEFLPGKVVLHRDHMAGSDPSNLGPSVWAKPMEANVPELTAAGQPVELELRNVDYRVTVRVNGRVVLETTDADYYPDIKALFDEADRAAAGRGPVTVKPVVRILAGQQTGSLEHIHLQKDVYYINVGHHYEGNGPAYSSETFFGSPENIQHLGPDEYFVLGDNSQVSLDARFWGAEEELKGEGNYLVRAGRVPGRFMLGKAFFVYWPAGYRPENFPYGIRPDFGDMRFIH